MNADELFDLVTSGTDVLRVETLDAYDAESDADFVDRFLAGGPKPDPAEKATWLGLISAAAERGHPWRRLRVVNRPVTDYVRYACEWGYTDNVAAGEDVRVIDGDSRARRIGDLYIVDGGVYVMRYNERGEFVEAVPSSLARMPLYRGSARRLWEHGASFTEWWTANPDLHRTLTSA